MKPDNQSFNLTKSKSMLVLYTIGLVFGFLNQWWYNWRIMEKREDSKETKRRSGFKTKSQKLKAKVLKSYYGNPLKDMKLIAITGATGKTIVAHFVHEILRSSGEQVAVLASDRPFKMGILHKFLNDAWKAGANIVIVTVPAESLRDNVFYGLPVTVAAMTNFVSAGLNDMSPEEYLDCEKTLFDMRPQIVVLNKDDANFETFSHFRGEQSTAYYGLTGADVKILNSKLYPKGTEATFSINTGVVTVATFVTGETAVPYMACAAAIANELGIPVQNIVDGIAEYNPE
jgi:UDP-N-acetylmuramoyl-L-alanyl-D-glutamate--2,6-diaminopimelate ligase